MQNPYEKYRSNAVFTAPKEELTLMLYEGALKFCNQAMVALEQKDYMKTSDLICKVRDIISEFQVTLDMKYDISKQLNVLYDYINHRLIEANLKKDMEILEDVRQHLRSMRDTWKEAMKLAKQGAQPGASRSRATV